ncbi:hypothetical protein FRC12_001797 [Ceratobasidium sp. 428]|nr:hypothetical protein FRC12_001797 [Ceratobasidium sp. 428]
MEGVSASDFADLMTVLYTNHFLEDRRRPELTPPQISTVFRLADMWNFEELRAYLKPLAETILGDADKIALAREANVTEWLAPAHARLCLREKKIATQEASKLGLNSLLFISRFREDNPRKAIGTSYCVNCSRQHSCRSCPGFHSSRVECTQPQESEVMRKVQTWLKRGWGLLD